MVLRFRVGMAPYQAGETASFTSREAEKILARNIAVVVEPEPEPDFEEMTKAEMMKQAASLGLTYNARMTKAELLDLLRGETVE